MIKAAKLLRNIKPEYDVVIVGGGCNGAGTLLDCAKRGLNCLLVQQHDYASGASSKSSKLLHGGMRYLQEVFSPNGDLASRTQKWKLLKEALYQRSIVLQSCPGIAHPLSFLIPCKNNYERFYYYLGSYVYHLTYKAMIKDRALPCFQPPRLVSDLKSVYPGLNPNFKYGVVYDDAFFNDSRLNIQILLKANQQQSKPDIVNRCALIGIKKHQDKVIGVTVRDQIQKKQHQVRCKMVINCTGPFADSVRKMQNQQTKGVIKCVAGSHLVFDKPEFSSKELALCIPKTSDGRILFTIPHSGSLIVGTSQNSLPAPTNQPQISKAELDFILKQLQLVLSCKVPNNYRTYTGIRPLVGNNQSDTKSIARSHVIESTNSGLISVMGGKWTTYRLVAEQATDLCVSQLAKQGFPADKLKKCETGRQTFCQDIPGCQKYGSRVGFATGFSLTEGMKEEVYPGLGLSKGDIKYFTEYQQCHTPSDILFRRTRLGLTGDVPKEAVQAVRQQMQRWGIVADISS